MVILAIPFAHTVGNDGTYRQCFVSQQLAEAIYGRGFHLVVGNASAFVAELLNFVIQFRVCGRKSEGASLWAVESGSRNGGAGFELIGHEMLYQLFRSA